MVTVEAHGPDYILRCPNCGDATAIATPEGNPLWFLAAVLSGYEDAHTACNHKERI